jgi:hypothetical protein
MPDAAEFFRCCCFPLHARFCDLLGKHIFVDGLVIAAAAAHATLRQAWELLVLQEPGD